MPKPKVDNEAVEHHDYVATDAPRPVHRRGSSASSTTMNGHNNQSPPKNETGRTPNAQRRRSSFGGFRDRRPSVAAQLKNPLTGMTEADVLADVDKWVDHRGLTHERDTFRRGAMLARVINTPGGFESIDLPEEEKQVLRREQTHRWSQPFMLYFLVVLCAGSAIVQGMDQTAVNGAQVSSVVTVLMLCLLRANLLIIDRYTTLPSSRSRMFGSKASSTVLRTSALA